MQDRQYATRNKTHYSPAIIGALLALVVIASGLLSYVSVSYVAKQNVIDYVSEINEGSPFEVEYVEAGFSKTHILRIHFHLTGVSELSGAIWYAKPFGDIILEK